jgi:pilus assembly protein CpaB
MNNRAVVLSALMAILAVFFVQSYVTSIEDEARRRFGTEVLVVVAKRDINEMETINETMLDLKSVPKKFIEPTAISFESRQRDSEKAQQELKDLSGAVAILPIKEGEQITFTKVMEPGLRTGLSPQVTPGKRAMSVPVGETSAVAKLVKPGDRVDVIAVIDLGGGKANKVAKTILQDIPVLAVGRQVTNNVPRLMEMDPYEKRPRVRSLVSFDGFTSVTLEVDPSQAQTLALMSAGGSSENALVLSLRNNDDNDRVGIATSAMTEIIGGTVRLPAGATGNGLGGAR